MLKLIRSLFRKPEYTVVTHKRKEVDCSLHNEKHKQLARELGREIKGRAA